ncbi:MAG: guanylate kinase [Clostridia bacterium]|nr:guanylate kinase [Clostridia bacterium]
MDKGKILVLSGPSGVGKGTIHHILLTEYENYDLSVSVTTRAPRVGEQEGVSYYYRTKEEFDALVAEGAFVEHATRYGNYYGTLKSELKRITDLSHHVILDIEYTGALNVKKFFPEALLIFLLPPSMLDLKKRIEGRGSETPESLLTRYGAACDEIREYAPMFDYVIVNKDIATCAKQVDDIVRGKIPALEDARTLIETITGGK